MRLILLLLLALALTEARPPPKCYSTLPFMEVCGYQGCFLNINQADMEFLNCDRQLRGKKPFIFVSEGKCARHMLPKCSFFEF